MSVQQLLPIGLGFIMFGVGINLKLENFVKVFKAPKTLLVGLANQIILLPLLALLLVLGYSGPADYALGIMILAACPGGITSNLLAVLAGGNAALSISMTALTSLLSLFTVPAVLWGAQSLLVGGAQPVHLPLDKVMGGIFIITALPVCLGMTFHHFSPKKCQTLQPYIKKAATLIFAFIVAGTFFQNREAIGSSFLEIGILLICLNGLTSLCGYFLAGGIGANRPDRLTICLEGGLQNVALAMFIALNILNNPPLAIPALIYAIVMNISALGIILTIRQLDKSTQTASN